MQNTPHDGGQHDADGALDAQGKGKQPTAKPLTVDDLRDALLGKNAPKDDRPDAVVLRELREGVKAVSITLKPPATLLAQTDYEHDRSKLMRSHREVLDKVSRQLNWGINRFSSQLPEARKKCNERPWKIDFHIQSAVPHLPLIYEKTGIETLAILITVYWSTMAKSVNDCETEKDRENWRYWFMDVLIGMCNAQVDRCIQAATEEVEELEKWLDARNAEYEQLPVPVLTNASDTSTMTGPGLSGPSAHSMPQGVPPLDSDPHTQSFQLVPLGGPGGGAQPVENDSARTQHAASSKSAHAGCVINQLDTLRHEKRLLRLELWFMQAVDANGTPNGEPELYHSDPQGEWPSTELVELWKQSGHLFGENFVRTDQKDFGLGRFLFSRSQRIADRTGINAIVIDPLERWKNALRDDLLTKERRWMVGTAVVEPDPHKSTSLDLQDVAAKAEFIAKQLAGWTADYKADLDRMNNLMKLLSDDSGRGIAESQRQEFRNSYENQRRVFEIMKCNIRHLQQDLRVVKHYATMLLPKELGTCIEICSDNWRSMPPKFNDEALKCELFTLANLFKTLEPPVSGISVQKPGLTKSIDTKTAEEQPPLPPKVKRLSAGEKAWKAHEYACEKVGLSPQDMQDAESFEWLREHGLPSGDDTILGLNGYEIPATVKRWQDCLSKHRSALGEKKYSSRKGGVETRSIKRKGEL